MKQLINWYLFVINRTLIKLSNKYNKINQLRSKSTKEFINKKMN